VSALFCALSLWGAGGAARADEVDACVNASERGQELRDQGKLRAARALFVTCAAAECPAIVRKDCTGWLAAVDEKLPSVVIHARGADGRDLADVRVTMDGETLASLLDGRAIAVDPGTHTFQLVARDLPSIRRTLLLREGDKSRPIHVVFGNDQARAEKGRTFSVPVVSWVLGGLSLAGFGALAGFGVSAQSAVEDMRATCAPGCSASRVDAARRDMILANVALGAGLATLGAAVVMVVVQNTGVAPKPPITAWKLGAGPGGLSLSAAW